MRPLRDPMPPTSHVAPTSSFTPYPSLSMVFSFGCAWKPCACQILDRTYCIVSGETRSLDSTAGKRMLLTKV